MDDRRIDGAKIEWSISMLIDGIDFEGSRGSRARFRESIPPPGAKVASVAAAGGINLLIDALETFSADATIQASACAALASLSVDNTMATAIRAKGVEKLVYAALKTHAQDPDVAEAAILLLGNIVQC